MAFSLLSPASLDAPILVVDDEPLVLRAMERSLKSAGFLTLASQDPDTALESVASAGGIVADLNLWTADGRLFARKAREVSVRVPIVVVTGEAELRTVSRRLDGTAVDEILAKPFDDDELVAAIYRSFVRRGHSMARTFAEGLLHALFLRDPEEALHARRCAAWSRMLGERMGLAPLELDELELGALLHDIGKIAIPDAVLGKRGAHTISEQAIMRTHTKLGYELLERVPVLADAAKVARDHHERWDGTGYPQGLQETAISLHARIFAVADAYDELTTDKPGMPGLPHDVACASLSRESGYGYDPEVLEAFALVPVGEWLAVRKRASEPPLFD